MVLREMGEPSQAGLAETLRIDPVNVVGLLNDLESAHLVERHRSPQDRHRHVVLLIETGSRRLDEIELALAGAGRRTLSALDADQMKTFAHLLQLITTSVAHSEEGPR